jgi:hypothetical protein
MHASPTLKCELIRSRVWRRLLAQAHTPFPPHAIHRLIQRGDPCRQSQLIKPRATVWLAHVPCHGAWAPSTRTAPACQPHRTAGRHWASQGPDCTRLSCWQGSWGRAAPRPQQQLQVAAALCARQHRPAAAYSSRERQQLLHGGAAGAAAGAAPWWTLVAYRCVSLAVGPCVTAQHRARCRAARRLFLRCTARSTPQKSTTPQPHTATPHHTTPRTQQKELKEIDSDKASGVTAEVVADNLQHLIGSVPGPKDTPYEVRPRPRARARVCACAWGLTLPLTLSSLSAVPHVCGAGRVTEQAACCAFGAWYHCLPWRRRAACFEWTFSWTASTPLRPPRCASSRACGTPTSAAPTAPSA